MDEHIYMHLQLTRVVMIPAQCDYNSLLLVMQFATRWSHINTVPPFMANRLSGLGRGGVWGTICIGNSSGNPLLIVSSVKQYRSFCATPLENVFVLADSRQES